MRISKDPQVRKQEILTAARILFEAKGIQKTTISEIADRVAVAKGLVYYYYRSKEELAEATILEIYQDLEICLSRIAKEQQLDFYDKLRAIFNAYFDTIRSYPTLLSHSASDPGIIALAKTRLYTIAFEQVSLVLEQGMAEQRIRIAYPQYMLRVLIYGLGDLYIHGIDDPAVHAVLVEQTLGLEKGRLAPG